MSFQTHMLLFLFLGTQRRTFMQFFSIRQFIVTTSVKLQKRTKHLIKVVHTNIFQVLLALCKKKTGIWVITLLKSSHQSSEMFFASAFGLGRTFLCFMLTKDEFIGSKDTVKTLILKNIITI